MNSLRTMRFTFNDSRFVAALIFVCTLALYIRTTAPTLGGAFDSEEFQHVAFNLDIAHATGYPLYLLLGKIFTTFVPIGNIAYRMNLLSALLGAATVAMVYLNALVLTRRQIASIATAALFATNPAVWRQAGVASVGPLNLLLFAAIVYTLCLWRARRLPLTVTAFLFGLSLAHHRTTLFLLPALWLFILQTDPGIFRRPRELARSLFFLSLPLLLYLYLPIFGDGSSWYSNTIAGFFNHVSGSEAGNYTRATFEELTQAFGHILQYLHDSFGYLGIVLILAGIASVLPQRNRWETLLKEARVNLFLGLALLTYIGFATFISGEQDRYFVLSFFFALFWFAIGAGTVENCPSPKFQVSARLRTATQIALALVLALVIALPFADRFRIADWSAFDRVYKQWDEIFTLPLPPNAMLVGNWGQLNAMRYMQRVEQRRPDLRFVGTLYDPTPQTDAAQDAFANNRTFFLSPGIALPAGSYRYAQLGPLLEVRDTPQRQAPAAQENISITPSLTLANYETTTALEPYAPLTTIAPNRTARVTLDWRADGSVKDFLVRVRLYDPEARLIAQKDEPPVRGLYPPSQWQRGEFVRDVHNFLIPAGSPPGKYQLKMQTLDAETKKPASDEIALASFAIERVTNLAREQVFIAHPLDIPMHYSIMLWGYGGFEGTHRAGDKITINLVWHATRDVGTFVPPRLMLYLRDISGRPVEDWWRDPITFYPPKEWRKGEVLKAYYDLQLPDDLPPGEYSLGAILHWDFSAPDIARIQIVP